MLTRILLFVLITGSFGSCTINKNLIFKTDQDFQFDQSIVDSADLNYKIGPNDFLDIMVFTNEGSLILELTTSSAERSRNIIKMDINYVVDAEGCVELPIIGWQQLSGMTVWEAQDFLESLYSSQFIEPYCVIRVINRRILVFNGDGSKGSVVPLLNSNISVIEALALAGGIESRGNSSKIKLIRSVGGEQEVYRIDLSTIEGIKYAKMVVESGDIIYVEPTPDIIPEALKDFQPVLQLITGISVLYVLFLQLR